MTQLAYDTFADSDRDAIAGVLCHAFDRLPEQASGWIDRHAPDHIRVVRADGHPVACAMLIDMGQHFGHRSVPMVGIAGVATAPTARGSGVATRLMLGIVHELHERRVPISTLYPATQPLYRRAGYEQAGVWPETTIRPADLPRARVPDVAVRPYEPTDDTAVRALCAEHALERNGSLDRNDIMWSRVHNYRDQPASGFVFERDGAIRGCLFFIRLRDPNRSAKHRLFVTECCAADRPTADRLLTFLADHASMVPEVLLSINADDPLLALLPEQTYTSRISDTWMLRITRLDEAIRARGYPPAVSTDATVRIEDDSLPAHNRCIRIRVSDGRAVVEPSEEAGAPTIDVRAFASLYTGFRTVRQLRTIGGVTGGTPEHLDALEQIFPGAPSELREMF